MQVGPGLVGELRQLAQRVDPAGGGAPRRAHDQERATALRAVALELESQRANVEPELVGHADRAHGLEP